MNNFIKYVPNIAWSTPERKFLVVNLKLSVQEEPLRKGPHGAAPARERVNGRARGFALAHLKHQDLEHLPRASPAARRTRPGETGTAPASPQFSSPCRYSLAGSEVGRASSRVSAAESASQAPATHRREQRATRRAPTRTPPGARSRARTAPSRPTPDR